MDLKNQTVLVTGAASGLGAATACYLKQLGAQLILVDYQAEALNDIAQALFSESYACDLTDSAAVEKMMQAIHAVPRAIRVLVNCAGVASGERIIGKTGPMPLANFEKVLRLNLVATFDMLRFLATHMSSLEPLAPDNERGVIINVASVAAFDGQLGQAAYSASKGGVAAMTLPAARELGKYGIRVMCIAPGVMKTPMAAGLKQEIIEKIVEQVPFPKRFGEPQEFAALVHHIIENRFLNGEVIRFDGGVRLV